MQKILVCTDLSRNSLAALDFTRTLIGGMEKTSYSVNLLYVVDVGATIISPEGTTFQEVDLQPFIQEVEEQGRKCLERFSSEYFPGSSCRTTVLRCTTPAYKEIIRFAESEAIDLLILAKQGKSGFQRFLMGSTTTKIVQLAECPVIVVPTRKSK